MGIGIIPAQLDGGDAPVGIGVEGDGVQGCGIVTSTDLAGIDSIVAKILISHIPVFIVDQAVVGEYGVMRVCPNTPH